MSLRPYQQACAEQVWRGIETGTRDLLLVLPTGGGKTRIFSFLTDLWRSRDLRTWILVHRKELLLQASKALTGLGVEHGLVAPGRVATKDIVQVASVDTILARMRDLSGALANVDRVIIDEAHHAVAGKWSKVREAMTRARCLGVTATPFRADGKGLGAVFQARVQGPSIRELTELGFLAPAVVYAPPAKVDLSKVRSRAGDYVVAELVAAVDRDEVTLPAVEHYRKLCGGKPTIVFCASVSHAQHVAEQFARAGFRAASVDGGMSDRERDAAIAGLGNGQLQVLTSCEIVSEGTDIPIVTGAILLRPTQSTALYLQQVGRVLRPAPGKAEAIIIDQVGNVATHGMPDEHRPWTLKGGIKGLERAVAATRRCRHCFVRCAQGPAHCPRCGRSYGVRQQPAPATTLFPVPPSASLPKSLPTLTDQEILIAPLKALLKVARGESELRRIAAVRGYKPGWVTHVMADRNAYRDRYRRRA